MEGVLLFVLDISICYMNCNQMELKLPDTAIQLLILCVLHLCTGEVAVV